MQVSIVLEEIHIRKYLELIWTKWRIYFSWTYIPHYTIILGGHKKNFKFTQTKANQQNYFVSRLIHVKMSVCHIRFLRKHLKFRWILELNEIQLYFGQRRKKYIFFNITVRCCYLIPSSNRKLSIEFFLGRLLLLGTLINTQVP